MFDDAITEKAVTALAFCNERNLKLATAESCTGGLIAASLTAISGASSVFERGFVTYSNEAKEQALGIPAKLIEEQGAVSGAVACAMAEGALKNSNADMAISCTGIAGPDGGTDEKPVGTVHLAKAFHTPDGIKMEHLACDFGEQDRHTIQSLTVKTALELIVLEPSNSFIA